MEWLQALKEAFRPRGARTDLKESRDSYRIRALLPATLQLGNKEAIGGMVLNFSAKGMKVSLPRLLKKESEVLVTVRGRRPPGARGEPRVLTLKARVVWCKRHQGTRDYDAGLQYVSFKDMSFNQVVQFFREELRLDITNTDQKRDMRRAGRRFPLKFEITESKKTYTGFVRDLSPSGVRFATLQDVPVGTEVMVEIELPENAERIRGKGKVVRNVRIPGEDWFDIAAPLEPATEGDRTRLNKILEETFREMHEG